MGVRQAIDITAGQRREILALLNRHLPDTTVWAYGSRVKWTSRPDSDLDLVAFARPEQSARVAELREAFEESSLPFRVDLFVWDEVSESFRNRIEVEQVALVERERLTPLLRNAATAERPAKVIHISSVDGIYVAHDESYSYTASKAGLNHLTRLMAKRLAADHIHVNAIAPGAFATDMNVVARDEPGRIEDYVPASRVGRPEDIAGAAVYMASRAGDYLVGITLVVDGGVTHAL